MSPILVPTFGTNKTVKTNVATVMVIGGTTNTAGPMEDVDIVEKAARTKPRIIKTKQLLPTRWVDIPTIAGTVDLGW